jgi:hypothetical protein
VVGITTFGVYTPSVITLSFLVLGATLGLVILLVVIGASLAMRQLLRRYRLAYTSRMAIVLTGVVLAIFVAVVGLAWFAPLSGGLANLGNYIFPILMIGTLAERFVSVQNEKGTYSAIQLTLEVAGVALLCYFIVGEWNYFRTLMLATPELVILCLGLDVLLGRYTGLRFTEYIRFRDIIKESEE